MAIYSDGPIGRMLEYKMLDAAIPPGTSAGLSSIATPALQRPMAMPTSGDSDPVKRGITALFNYAGIEQPFTLENDEYAPPRQMDIGGEPHQLAYITKKEGQALQMMGGYGGPVPGTQGIPAFMMSGDDEGGHGYSDDYSEDSTGGADYGEDSPDQYSLDEPTGVTANDPGVQALAESFYSYDPSMSLDEAAEFSDQGSFAWSANQPGKEQYTWRQTSRHTFVPEIKGFQVGPPVNIDPNNPIAKGIEAVFGQLAGPIAGLAISALGPPSVSAQALGHLDMIQAADEMDSGDGFDSKLRKPYGDPYNAPAIPAAPVAAAPVDDVVESVLTPLTLDEIVRGATQTGFPRFITTAAQGGGISSLAYGGDPSPMGFANQAFEGMVPGQGTGMSDSVPFSIEGQQPALLSRDEYVLPADVVSQLGDGSSGAGADMLDNFVSSVRQNKYGNTQQPPASGMGLIGGLMRSGGVV